MVMTQGPVTMEGLQVTLSGIINIEDREEWEVTTENFYEDRYNDSSDIFDAEVDVTITGIATTAQQRWPWRRDLQSSAVEVTYTQTTSYRSQNPNLLITEDVVAIPLSTQEYRDSYVEKLKGLGGYDALTDVSTISISSDKDEGSTPAPTPSVVSRHFVQELHFYL